MNIPKHMIVNIIGYQHVCKMNIKHYKLKQQPW